MIPYARQSIDARDIREVAKALKSDWITHGPRVRTFEDALCRYAGAKYAVALSSGSAALHLAVLAAGLRQDNHLITSAMTFAASANCALYVGAEPKFIDKDGDTYHMDLSKFADYVKVPSRRKKVKVVIPVHFSGTVMDIAALRRICDKYGIKIIEDAAHAMGAEYRSGRGRGK